MFGGVGGHRADYPVIAVLGHQHERGGQVRDQRVVRMGGELPGQVPAEPVAAPGQPGGSRGDSVGEFVVDRHPRQRGQLADRVHVGGQRLAHAHPRRSSPPVVELPPSDRLPRAHPGCRPPGLPELTTVPFPRTGIKPWVRRDVRTVIGHRKGVAGWKRRLHPCPKPWPAVPLGVTLRCDTRSGGVIDTAQTTLVR